jgi:hypothetical protein
MAKNKWKCRKCGEVVEAAGPAALNYLKQRHEYEHKYKTAVPKDRFRNVEPGLVPYVKFVEQQIAAGDEPYSILCCVNDVVINIVYCTGKRDGAEKAKSAAAGGK